MDSGGLEEIGDDEDEFQDNSEEQDPSKDGEIYYLHFVLLRNLNLHVFKVHPKSFKHKHELPQRRDGNKTDAPVVERLRSLLRNP
jgi:hypothetical protein